MWRISLRDLQYRLRRFLIAIAVTALVFGIAVAIDGIKQTLQREPADLVASFHADRWVVRRGARAHSRRRPYSPSRWCKRYAPLPGYVRQSPW